MKCVSKCDFKIILLHLCVVITGFHSYCVMDTYKILFQMSSSNQRVLLSCEVDNRFYLNNLQTGKTTIRYFPCFFFLFFSENFHGISKYFNIFLARSKMILEIITLHFVLVTQNECRYWLKYVGLLRKISLKQSLISLL